MTSTPTPPNPSDELRQFARDIVAAVVELSRPVSKRLSQHQVRRLNRVGRLLTDCYGPGELVLRTGPSTTPDHSVRRLVWTTREGPDVLLDSESCWTRHGRPRVRVIVRTVRRRVRLDRDIRGLQPENVLGELLDAVNGNLHQVR